MVNDRRDFLKFSGMLGAASLIPFGKASAETEGALKAAACTLIPTETIGPFPLDLTANNFYFRQDIRENRTGVPLFLKMKILGVDNCSPMRNARVNIWQCDKDGQYSGYDNSMNPGQAGLTYLRGYQVTNADGEVNFVTIFPGWYPGRTCHIHFQVYVSSSYAAISQLTWETTPKNALFSANASIYTKGVDPLAPAQDGVFRNGYALQVATLTPNTAKGGYDSYMEVSVQGTGSTGIGHLEREQAKRFTLGQSFPNPYLADPTIPFMLKQPADVVIGIYDLSGKRVASIPRNGLAAGEHAVTLKMNSLGLPHSDYLYQIEVSNSAGTFREYRMMTAGRR